MDKTKYKRKRELYSVLLVLILVGITIGYAALTSNLNINGTTRVSSSSWDIHFANVVVNSNSVAIGTGNQAATITQNDPTEVTYNVSLSTPGDFYEFTVDAVNAGTVDGMIDGVTSKLNNTVIDNEHPLPSYLEYSVTYADGRDLYTKQKLAAGATETYKVRVEFKQDIANNELPATDQTQNFAFEVAYAQGDNTAQDRLTYQYSLGCQGQPDIVTTTEPSTDLYLVLENGNGSIVNRILRLKLTTNGPFIELIGGDGGLAYLRNKELITRECPSGELSTTSEYTKCEEVDGREVIAYPNGDIRYFSDEVYYYINANGTYSIQPMMQVCS